MLNRIARARTASIHTAAEETLVQVIVLGTYHFANPSFDRHRFNADDVLSLNRQIELDSLGRALLAFRPTRVMVEAQSDEPEFSMPSFAHFTIEQLKTERDETVQIGYRVAKLAGLSTVHGIDASTGRDDLFEAFLRQAAQPGRSDILGQSDAHIAAETKRLEELQKRSTIARLLIEFNDPARRHMNGMDAYYSFLSIGDRERMTGVEINADWYQRNCMIFGKLTQVARPGDRVLVVFGSGHGFWLRHFASNAPGYRLVDSIPFLRSSDRLARQ